MSTHRLLLAAAVSGLLGTPQELRAERPLPDWAEWQTSQAIRTGERALLRGEEELGLTQAIPLLEFDLHRQLICEEGSEKKIRLYYQA